MISKQQQSFSVEKNSTNKAQHQKTKDCFLQEGLKQIQDPESVKTHVEQNQDNKTQKQDTKLKQDSSKEVSKTQDQSYLNVKAIIQILTIASLVLLIFLMGTINGVYLNSKFKVFDSIKNQEQLYSQVKAQLITSTTEGSDKNYCGTLVVNAQKQQQPSGGYFQDPYSNWTVLESSPVFYLFKYLTTDEVVASFEKHLPLSTKARQCKMIVKVQSVNDYQHNDFWTIIRVFNKDKMYTHKIYTSGFPTQTLIVNSQTFIIPCQFTREIRIQTPNPKKNFIDAHFVLVAWR